MKHSYAIILIIILLTSIYIFLPVAVKNKVAAFTSNYNRTSTENTMTLEDWNALDDDFLFRDGSNTMLGDLDMGGNRITNLGMATVPGGTDAVNVQYVNNAITAAGLSGSGGMYVEWGRNTCTAGSLVYSGVAFSAPYNYSSGGSNPICIQSGSAGPAFLGTYADQLFPVVTGGNLTLPTSLNDPVSSITGNTIIQCALCFNPSGTCYEHYGEHNCGAGFTEQYSGYVLGSYATQGVDSHYNSTQRACVNRNYDSSLSAGGQRGAMWYGSKIQEDFGTGYTNDAFVRCSICCN